MFGYVRISKAELDERSFERFKGYYCGLCGSIGKYSHIARLGLSYDMTFLTVLLAAVCDTGEEEKRFRCIFKPRKKEKAIIADVITDYAAEMSILLAYKKIEDDLRDEKSIRAFLGKLLYEGPYKKIKNKAYSEKISELLKRMTELEKSGCDEPDEIADCFAKICEVIFTPDFLPDEDTRRVLAWMGYNVGRWIYLLDAFDDLEKDMKSNSYNPLAKRYSGKKSEIETTLTYNLANIAAAYDLLDVKRNDEIIKNILYAGMGGMQNKVLNLPEGKNESLRGSRCKSE